MDLEPYVARQRAIARHAAAQRQATAGAARARLPELVARLVGFGATKVVVFGSLVRGELDVDSDVDVAVRGLPAARHFEAMSAAAAAMQRPVDVVRLEEAPPTLASRVDADGEILHDGS